LKLTFQSEQAPEFKKWAVRYSTACISGGNFRRSGYSSRQHLAPCSGTVSWKNTFNDSQPQQLRSERRPRSYRKYRLRILGTLKIKCRCGTALITCSHNHSPNSTTLFWWHEGQKCVNCDKRQYLDFFDSLMCNLYSIEITD